MRLTLLSPPAGEPVDLAEAKAWLRVGSAAEDGLIAGLIAAARERVEAETGLALMAREVRETLEAWPARRGPAHGQAFTPLLGPLIAVSAARLIAPDGRVEPWDPAEWRAEPGEPGRIVAILPFGLPPIAPRGGRMEIDYRAGYGASAADAPAALREAVLRIAGEAYADARSAERAERGPASLSEGVEALLRPFRRVRL